MESEHQSRLQVMQQHLEQLKQQEQHLYQANSPSPSLLGLGPPCQGPEPLPTASLSPFLLGMGQERLSMAHQRRQLEQLREELPNNPVTLLTADQDLSAPTKGLSSVLCKASCMLLMGRDMLGGSCTCIPLLRRLGMFLGAVLVPLYINLRCELASSSSEGAQRSSLSQGSARRG